MQLADLLSQHRIKISPQSRELSERAIPYMQKSLDPLHDYSHVQGILQELDDFLRLEKRPWKDTINFDVLIPAIFWHDTWKAQQTPARSIRESFFQQLWDGPGSVRVLRPVAEELSIDRPVHKAINHAVFRHSHPLFFFPPIKPYVWRPKRVEGRILRDLDLLDAWQMRRLNTAVETYLIPGKTPQWVRGLGLWWTDKVLRRTTAREFSFSSSREKFISRKRALLQAVEKIIAEQDRYFG